MAAFVLRENFREFLAESAWRWTEPTSVFKMALLNGWTPPAQPSMGGAWDLFYSHISAYEIALAGYTAGGKVLTPSLPSLEGTAQVHWRLTDAEWASLAAGTVSHAALWMDDTVYQRVVGYVEVGLKQPDGGAYAVRWPVDGVIVW